MVQRLRGECQQEHERVRQDRVIYIVAVNARIRETQQETAMTNRLRDRSIEMQRTIEELVGTRDLAREEAARCRQGEAVAASAARQARERTDPSVHQLREQLREAQQELMAATSPPVCA